MANVRLQDDLTEEQVKATEKAIEEVVETGSDAAPVEVVSAPDASPANDTQMARACKMQDELTEEQAKEVDKALDSVFEGQSAAPVEVVESGDDSPANDAEMRKHSHGHRKSVRMEGEFETTSPGPVIEPVPVPTPDNPVQPVEEVASVPATEQPAPEARASRMEGDANDVVTSDDSQVNGEVVEEHTETSAVPAAEPVEDNNGALETPEQIPTAYTKQPGTKTMGRSSRMEEEVAAEPVAEEPAAAPETPEEEAAEPAAEEVAETPAEEVAETAPETREEEAPVDAPAETVVPEAPVEAPAPEEVPVPAVTPIARSGRMEGEIVEPVAPATVEPETVENEAAEVPAAPIEEPGVSPEAPVELPASVPAVPEAPIETNIATACARMEEFINDAAVDTEESPAVMDDGEVAEEVPATEPAPVAQPVGDDFDIPEVGGGADDIFGG